jgi:RNA polymerase sigma-70 factor (ECF subfamily)
MERPSERVRPTEKGPILDPVTSLATAAAGGDAGATAELLRSAWPDAYRIAWSVLRDRQAAEDAAQEACAQVVTAITTLRRPERFPVWFYRIVVNEAHRCRRRTAREVTLVDDVPSDDGLTPEDHLDLRDAVGSLDTTLRVTVVLHYYFALNSAEIAKVLGASPITIRWRLMVARRRLRSLLAADAASTSAHTTIRGDYADESHALR